jgi:transposase-like protein
MPLSRALANVTLTNPCPHCGHKLEKKGSWFQSIEHYSCEACRGEVNIT